MFQKISTTKAPAAIGPYSQAIRAGEFLFASGQIPINPETGAVEAEGIEAQTEQVMKNAAFNGVYEKYFTGKPARSCVAVKKLPKDVLCEVEVIAYLGE